MEAALSLPRTCVALDDLAEVVKRPGPFLTVHLTTEGDIENAAQRSLQRWKALRASLEDEGVPAAALDAVEPVVADAHLEGSGLSVIATVDGVQHVEHLREEDVTDHGTWAAVPELLPTIRSRQAGIPYVLALADHGGADIVAVHPGHDDLVVEAGDHDPVRKVSAGGWSQRRFQQRAEEDWQQNAAGVAGAITRLADAIDARLIVVGGDVKATHLIERDLPHRFTGNVHLIEPGRAADGSHDAREREVHRLVATAVAEDTVELLQLFEQERGRGEHAVDGAVATVDAVNQAAVQVLLVHEDRHRTASVSEGVVPLTAGAEGPALVDALVAGALVTGASVRVVPSAGPVKEGIGGILRWSLKAQT